MEESTQKKKISKKRKAPKNKKVKNKNYLKEIADLQAQESALNYILKTNVK